MNMIGGQHTSDNIDALLAADVTANVPDAQPDVAPQDLEAVLGGPDDVIPVVKDAVAAGGILHVDTFRKMSLRPGCGSFF